MLNSSSKLKKWDLMMRMQFFRFWNKLVEMSSLLWRNYSNDHVYPYFNIIKSLKNMVNILVHLLYLSISIIFYPIFKYEFS